MFEFLKQNNLTESEIKVVLQVVKGLSNREVSTNNGITEKTVKLHLTNVYSKIGINSRAQLIVKLIPYMGGQ